MEEKDRDVQPGRRLEEKKDSRGGRLAVICVAAAAGVLLAGYLGLCALAGGDKALPGTCLGEVELGGMTQAEAQEALERVSTGRFEALELPIRVGEKTVVFSAKEAGIRVTGDAQAAVRAGKENFFVRGWNYLAGLLGRKHEVAFAVSVENAEYVDQVFSQVVQAVDRPMEPPRWELEEGETDARLILYKGKTGQGVDLEELRGTLMDALGRGDAEPIQARISTAAPGELDYEAMAREIDREAVNATLDMTTDEIVPHKLGLKVDAEKAGELVKGLKEGESAALELEVSLPEVTTLDLRATLFRDVLGEATSKVSGTANRVSNVTLAAAACNGVVLLPGERFSYNTATGERSAAKGYKMAPGYTAGGSVDMIGGGVCQPSSTLYYACLKADMEIVERHNHRYNVGYVPDGMDATVSTPYLDYVFANNTPYPIKIELLVENRVCTARILGTKTDDTYIETESNSYNYVAYQTVYQADESVPQGTTKVLMSPHTGRTTESYKKHYAADGTLMSRTLIGTDQYQPCNQIIGYNPLDGAPDGSVAPAGAMVDTETLLPVDENGDPIDRDPAAADPAGQSPEIPDLPGVELEPVAPAEPTQEPPVSVPEGIVVE